MKKTTFNISFDEDKASALVLYLSQKGASAEAELEKALDERLDMNLEILRIKDEDSRAEWKAAEQRRRAKETEREQESTPRGGFFSGLFGGRDDDKPRKNQPPEF